MLNRAEVRVTPVASAEEALEVLVGVPEIRAVVTDMELSLRGSDGLDLIRTIQKRWPYMPVVVVSEAVAAAHDQIPSGVLFLAGPVHNATLAYLIQAVVRTYVSQGIPQAQDTAGLEYQPIVVPGEGLQRDPLRSAADLTLRQQEVLQLLAKGNSNRDIAQALGMSENTVKVHLSAVFRSLGVSSRTEAALAARGRVTL
jgi:DNA-binding NarL/FixJ family response regulator